MASPRTAINRFDLSLSYTEFNVAANAVVLRDVPAGATAVGVPARIIPARTAPETAAATFPRSS